MIKRNKIRYSVVEREEQRVQRATRFVCDCCGVPVRRQPGISALYAVLCRGCLLSETSVASQEGH